MWRHNRTVNENVNDKKTQLYVKIRNENSYFGTFL